MRIYYTFFDFEHTRSSRQGYYPYINARSFGNPMYSDPPPGSGTPPAPYGVGGSQIEPPTRVAPVPGLEPEVRPGGYPVINDPEYAPPMDSFQTARSDRPGLEGAFPSRSSTGMSNGPQVQTTPPSPTPRRSGPVTRNSERRTDSVGVEFIPGNRSTSPSLYPRSASW